MAELLPVIVQHRGQLVDLRASRTWGLRVDRRQDPVVNAGKFVSPLWRGM